MVSTQNYKLKRYKVENNFLMVVFLIQVAIKFFLHLVMIELTAGVSSNC